MDVQPADAAFALIDDGDALEADLMEDLEGELADPRSGPAESEPVNPSETLRAAAEVDPAIRALVKLEDEIRGPDLQPWLRGGQDWTVLAPLDVRPHPEPTAFDEMRNAGPMPAGEQRLVVGAASARTSINQLVNAGGRVQLIGISPRAAREAGRTELMFNAGGRIMTARLVGDWPIDHQVGGLLLVPVSDPLVGDDSAYRDRLREIIAALTDRDAPRDDRSTAPDRGGGG